MHQNKDEVFERGVINVFKGLAGITKPTHPVNLAVKLSSTIGEMGPVGISSYQWNAGRSPADLERMLHLLSGKPIPDNRGISPLIWMTTYSPFRVKDAMK